MGNKTRSALSSRAWNLLRLALIWARKGSIFKRTALLHFLKNLRPAHRGRSLNYGRGEREFSFDDTPMFKFKRSSASASKRFPSIPCINPSGVAVDDFYDDDEDEVGDIASQSWQRKFHLQATTPVRTLPAAPFLSLPGDHARPLYRILSS